MKKVILIVVILIILAIIIFALIKNKEANGRYEDDSVNKISIEEVIAKSADEMIPNYVDSIVNGEETKEFISYIQSHNGMTASQVISAELKAYKGSIEMTSDEDVLSQMILSIGGENTKYRINLKDTYEDGSYKSFSIVQEIGTSEDPEIQNVDSDRTPEILYSTDAEGNQVPIIVK